MRTNQQIRVPEVRLIDQSGEQVGIVSIDEAIRHAQEVNMDLVEISPGVTPPVCRIMDYGKYIFDQKKKQSQQKKKQKQVQVKEIKFRPTTDIGDYKVKCRKITDFLERGDKVKITIRFRGREIWHNDLGAQLLERLKTDIENVVVEQEGQMEGRQMTMVMAPGKGGGSQVKDTDKDKDKEKKVETDEE